MRSSVDNIVLMRQIETLHRKKLSTSEIGNTLGYTKNQIVGLINRGREAGYDFPKRKSEFTRYKMQQAKLKSSKVKETQYKPIVKINKHAYTAIEDMYSLPVITEIPPEGLPLLKVPNNGCRFPIGQDEDNTHLYCAQPKAESSYCLKHMKIMWPNRYLPVQRSTKHLPSK